MLVPVIAANARMYAEIADIFLRDQDHAAANLGDTTLSFDPVPVDSHQAAVEYITYQMPPLMVIDFSDPAVAGFDLMERVAADPWLHNGGILAVYGASEDGNRIADLKQSNLLVSLHRQEVARQLPTVLQVVRANRQILIQRAMQSDLLSTITGYFTLGMDLLLVPCYANLVANYLYNMSFVDAEGKARIALVLTEMLTNAIEHGSCEITAGEKTRHLESGGRIHDLIARRMQDPRFAPRTVFFGYEILGTHSTFVIRDQGRGFDWRRRLKLAREGDILSLHGRGIMLTVESVAAMAYNDAGNEVTLGVKHRQNASNAAPSAFHNSEIVTVAPNDVVCRQGEESTSIFYVAEGEFRVIVNGRTVSTITPNDILVGEMSFLLDERRTATVIANTHGRLIRINKEEFIKGIKAQPYYAIFLAKLLAQRLWRVHNQP
jgi:anti-sigma regulatory factor (Ser/Thr protein kinase)/CheY-like chemotaxis protein